MEHNTIIDLSSVVQRNEERYLANRIGEEMVMMDMEAGDFISMNVVGADIWDSTEKPVAVKDLIEQLMLRYDSQSDQCTNDTIRFLQLSLEQKIFNLHNQVAVA